MDHFANATMPGETGPWSDPSPHLDLLEPQLPYGEDLLQFIWETRLFDHHALRTVNGEPIDVVRPGVVQNNSGPDLNGAQIRIDGQLWAGPVEVHLRSSEWNSHGHQFDPAYENVVLHVVYEHDLEVRTLRGRLLPTLELFPRIATESIALYRGLMTNKRSVPCASQIGRVNGGTVAHWLDRVLGERLQRKAEKVIALHDRLGRDAAATFYHMLLQAMGLKVNAEPFEMLADALPLKLLMKYRDDAIRTEALLFGQAGLLQVDHVDDHPRHLQREYRVLQHLHALRPIPLVAWKFGRIRPVNFPTLRLAQLAKLFTSRSSPMSDLLEAKDFASIHAILDLSAEGYWWDHYQFDRISVAGRKPIGRSAIQHIVINGIVPTLIAFSSIQRDRRSRDRAYQLLQQLPAETNSILAEWAAVGLVAVNAGQGQALLELKQLYCNKRRCLSCGIGNELLKLNSRSARTNDP